jgi:hypothetical protein
MYANVKASSTLEDALLYAIPFATLMLTGPGRFSIDQQLAMRRTAAPRPEHVEVNS